MKRMTGRQDINNVMEEASRLGTCLEGRIPETRKVQRQASRSGRKSQEGVHTKQHTPAQRT